jgi:hypothetical protein
MNVVTLRLILLAALGFLVGAALILWWGRAR